MIGFSQNDTLTALSTFAVYASIYAELDVPFITGTQKSLKLSTSGQTLGYLETLRFGQQKKKIVVTGL